MNIFCDLCPTSRFDTDPEPVLDPILMNKIQMHIFKLPLPTSLVLELASFFISSVVVFIRSSKTLLKSGEMMRIRISTVTLLSYVNAEEGWYDIIL